MIVPFTTKTKKVREKYDSAVNTARLILRFIIRQKKILYVRNPVKYCYVMSKIDKTLRPDEVDELLKSSFRTTALFELLAKSDKSLTIGDISANMNIPQSSASSLVKSLLDTGYVQKVQANNTYHLSARLAFLGATSLPSFPDVPKLLQKIDKLKYAIEETIVVAMRRGLHSLYIYVNPIRGQDIDKHVVLGSMRPLLCSATGRAMLMNSEEDLGKLVRSTCAEVNDPYWIQSAKSAPNAILEARANGYAFYRGPSGEGTSGLAYRLDLKGILGPTSIGIAAREQDIINKKDLIISNFKNLKESF